MARGAPERTVGMLLLARATARPTAIAVDDDGVLLTYGDLLGSACREAAWLAEQGVSRGDRVAVVAPRSVSTLVTFLGVQLLGAVSVFVNEQLRPRQVEHILEHSGARVLVVPPGLREIATSVSTSADILCTLDHEPRGAPRVAPGPAIGRDVAALIYTSGSTGRPKGVVVTHDNLLAGASIVAGYLDLSAEDRTLAALPWNFDYGFNQVLSTWFAGGRIVLTTSTFAPAIVRTMLRGGVTGVAAVPPMWELLLREPSPFVRAALPTLRYVTNSGGALRPGAIEAIQQAHPHVLVFLMYGLTEAFRSTFLPPELLAEHSSSIGYAIPDTEILVVDADDRPCDDYEVGELVHRGPTVAAGYWCDPEATTKVFRPNPLAHPGAAADTVVYSGDLVFRDREGLLYFRGRRDGQFKSRGIRVNPSEIEEVVLASGLVAQVVVFGVERASGDADVVAVVELASAASSVTVDDLVALCRDELPEYQVPREVTIVDHLPRGGTGKIDRQSVQDRWMNAHGSLRRGEPS